MTLTSRSPDWATNDLETPAEARISRAQNTTHDRVMNSLAKSLSVTGDILSNGTEFAALGIVGGTKIAAKTLFKSARGIVRGLSA